VIYFTFWGVSFLEERRSVSAYVEKLTGTPYLSTFQEEERKKKGERGDGK